MARAGSGSKFVSVNLNKSYGQPSSAASSAGGASASSASSSASGLPGSGRSRLPSSHGGMLLLTRPSRPQPASSSSSSLASKGSKLAVPRPVNLPSLRREHAGNDPTIALVGGSGSAGWTKQQIPSHQVEDTPAQPRPFSPGAPVVDAAAGLVRSTALTSESTWGAPVSQGRGHPATDGANQNGDVRPPPYQAPIGRPSAYTPPGARNAKANGVLTPTQPLPPPVQKAVVLRGEDFPTLQAALPSPNVPPQQRQKDLQQKQREKQQELKEQHKKLQQLSQQQQHVLKTGEDESPTQQHSVPQLQPEQPMRPQLKPKQPPNLSKDETQSLDRHETVAEQPNGRSRKAGAASYGPSPLIRWSHTSNWTDDERETLQNFRPQGMVQSDWGEPGRPRNDYRPTDHRAVEHSGDFGYGRPSTSRSGSLAGFGRDGEDLQDTFPARNGVLRLEGRYGRDGDLNSGMTKEVHSDRVGLENRDDMGRRDGSFGRHDNLKRGWGSFKDPNFSRDTRYGSSNRPSNFNRDVIGSSDKGFERDTFGRRGRDTGNGRGTMYRGEDLGRDVGSRDGYSRDGGIGRESGTGKDAFYGRRGAVGSSQDGGRGWQGDRVGGSNGYQFEGPASYGRTSSYAGSRGMHDLGGLDYGRDRRSNASYGQLHVEDPFLGDFLDPRSNSGFGMEPLAGALGLEIKALRRKKEESKEDKFRDLERESFEAELERVQKMQEQERQRMIEEREKAIELARKEQEERERLAREEEELRLKLEEEAREAAARVEKEAEEAARKLEEERRAREEEKHMMLLEEERRKEAARRKLLELEERIAKRESEKKRDEVSQEEERVYAVRPTREEEVIQFREEPRKREDVDWEDQERFTPSFSRTEQEDDERAPFKASRPLPSPPTAREFSEEPSSRLRPLETSSRPSDFRGGHAGSFERSKSVQMWRRETLENGHGPPLTSSLKPAPRDDFPPNWQREQPQRGFSPREPFYGAPRNLPSSFTQDRVPSELYIRNDRVPYAQEQRWSPHEDMRFSAKYPPVDTDHGYVDSTNDRDSDRRWGRDNRDNRHRLREGQRLTSPPLPSYLNGADTADYLSFGRLRQSLPKQPRVPPPPSRAPLQRPPLKPENGQSVSSALGKDDSGIAPQASMDFTERADVQEDELDDAEHVELLDDLQPPKQQETDTFQEPWVQPDTESQVSEHETQDALPQLSQDHPDEPDENTVSEPSVEEVDQAVLNLSAAAESREEFETEITKESQASRAEELTDDEENEEDWVLEEEEDDPGEVENEGDFDQVQNEGADEELEVQEPASSKVITEEGDANDLLADEYEEVNVEEQTQEDASEEEDDREELEKPLDSQPEDITEAMQEVMQQVGQEAEVQLEEPIVQETKQEPVTQPFLQQGSFLPVNAMESVQMGQSEVLSSRQSLVQQFQQPFSFMAVPLPQSNTSNTVSQHPSMLASMHGLQNQQEMPFHLQLGLLPGAPLMPNAIQIGSIQMPLHLHPQMPQLAHLHGPQPPMFQFGQIGHSAPLSQPLPIVQPAVQTCHPMGQPVPAQHHQSQSEALSRPDPATGLQQSDQLSKPGDSLPPQKPSPVWIHQSCAAEAPNHIELITTRNGTNLEFYPQRKDQTVELPIVVSQENRSDVKASMLKEQTSQHAISVVETGQEALPDKGVGVSAADVMAVESTQGDEGSFVRPSGTVPGGRRRSTGGRGYGILGRGRGRFHGGKTYGFEAPYPTSDASWSEMGAEGIARNRAVRRNFRRAEYKVRDSGSSLDRNLSDVATPGKQQSSRERSQALGSEVSNAPGNRVGGTNKDGQRDSGTQMYSRSVGGEGGQSAGAIVGSRLTQTGGKGDRPSSLKGPVKNVVPSSSRSTEGIMKKYRHTETAGDVPLQTGVVCVFEQPGIETPNDEDDFIEVRSKRQMWREQREQREKENKAKSKDLKAKEQAARKQQRLSVKVGQHGEAAGSLSSKSSMERRFPIPGPSAETASNDSRLAQPGHSSGMGTNVPQSCISTSAQALPPIGTPTGVLSDTTLEKRPKVSKPGQANSALSVTLNDSATVVGSAYEIQSGTQDNLSNTTTAWGGQRSTHKVVSLTQIQLEEAMKPIRFEGPLSQKLPITERDSMVLEPGIPVASMVALEKAPAPVKAPAPASGPISSFLAGEKIQFGAVTSPTLMSSSSHPFTPAILAGVGSSLGSRSDGSLDGTIPKSQVRHLSGSNGDVTFTSKGKRAREEDDMHGHVVDSEAEAEAAASAVAVAAISSDESVGSAHHSDARNAVLGGGAMAVSGNTFENIDSIAGSSGVPITRPVIAQAPVIEDSMAVALPADLSVETPSPMLQGPPSSGQGSSGLMLPGGASPFPCLEMGTMLGGPIFAFGPREDASSLSQGSRPGSSLEPGLAAIGAGGVGGWQQRHSGTADSFYGGPPSGFAGPFISPAGGIPSIQGPPHMFVYTNPFAPVGQFGQLGVRLMGTYLPSGKEPDWKHTPMTTSSPGASGLTDGDMSAGLSGMMTSQRSTGVSNSVQRIPPAGSSVMPAAPPLGLFDVNLSAPFQISNADVPMQSHWSKVPAPPLHSVPISGPVVGLNVQPRHSGGLPNQIGHMPHLMETSSGFHQLPVSKPVASSPFSSVDAAAQFPDELGLGDSVSSNTSLLSGGQRPSNRGHASNMAAPGTPGSSGNKSQRGRRSSRNNTRGGNNASASATGSNSGNLVLGTSSGSSNIQASNGSRTGSHFQTQNLGQSGSLGHHSHSLGFADQRASSQQGLPRATVGNEWSGNSHRRGAPGRTLIADRGPVGDRGFVTSSKLKQVYVAKPAATSRKLGAASAESGSSIFSGQEVARAAMGC